MKTKRKLSIVIEAGESTCASEPGKFCSWAGSRKFGQIGYCTLFNEDLDDKEGTSWLARLPACMEAEQR